MSLAQGNNTPTRRLKMKLNMGRDLPRYELCDSGVFRNLHFKHWQNIITICKYIFNDFITMFAPSSVDYQQKLYTSNISILNFNVFFF